MASDDREDIERKTQALEQASTAILQKMYEQSAGGGGQGPSGSAGGEQKDSKQEDVLDAEFEEVKESDRKKA